ncbi:4-(cytidine 5'-diphospho)-2-C-methyl-D-erythritol kinase [Millionella massiliensis]|uniref:4-(cytidine 5'-diphospho)-2-C-methyl-D-erythritol kinase n=1 Tax=Millionella massiliensis TaxID=1871023 RepID=UPI0023A896CC|nr:4-(cytidine 5'-diphospho)-2-C-methyl-D-erythritol kinase [Millionella massiliensis]
MILFPHCKINLGLHIIARRPDGYHDIETLFYPVRQLRDALELLHGSTAPDEPAATTDIAFSSSGLTIDCAPEKNLCVKACRLLQADFPDRFPADGLRLHLHKAIPFGAGLGGGSADATATLLGLNQMLRLGLTTEQLTPYAARLGSDTVFFLHDTPMLGSGRGERLTPYPDLDLSGWWLKLVKPDLNISTAEAYAGVPPHLPTAPRSEILRQPVEQWRESLVNDFEEPLSARYPQLRAIREALYCEGAAYAALSGSGSTVFGLFRQEPAQKSRSVNYFTHVERL